MSPPFSGAKQETSVKAGDERSFTGQFYEQIDGMAMGSPLSLVIANFFMEDFGEILSTLVHRAIALCDQDFFRHNSYSDGRFARPSTIL
jgi:hypothetical protein